MISDSTDSSILESVYISTSWGPMVAKLDVDNVDRNPSYRFDLQCWDADAAKAAFDVAGLSFKPPAHDLDTYHVLVPLDRVGLLLAMLTTKKPEEAYAFEAHRSLLMANSWFHKARLWRGRKKVV